jgi:chromosome segregation ATPase
LRALQRAVSESQRVAAERAEELEKVRAELEAASSVTSDAEARVVAKLDAAARELKAEREKAASVELVHNAAVAAATANANAQVEEMRVALAAAQAEAAKDRERAAELQKSVEHLSRAGEEAKELWERLKEALNVRGARVAGANARHHAARRGPRGRRATHARWDGKCRQPPARRARVIGLLRTLQ